LEKVKRRFVTRFQPETGFLEIQFGAGILSESDEDVVPDPLTVGTGLPSTQNKLTIFYDPSNFLYTGTYGLAPSNTVLTIEYYKGGGLTANVPSNTITKLISFGGAVSGNTNSLTFNNPEPATGGKGGESVEELRQNILRTFNEQGRTVTPEDFNVRILSLPPKYGAVAKVYTTQEMIGEGSSTNPLALSSYLLAYDGEGKLTQCNTALKENIRKYLSQYLMETDAVDLKDAYIVNIEVLYEIVLKPNFQGREVLIECNKVVKDYLSTTKRNINEAINLSTLYSLLDGVKGVQTVQKITIQNLYGGKYSDTGYDISGAKRGNIIYPSLDPMIFEIKYPETDIKGRITTL